MIEMFAMETHAHIIQTAHLGAVMMMSIIAMVQELVLSSFGGLSFWLPHRSSVRSCFIS